MRQISKKNNIVKPLGKVSNIKLDEIYAIQAEYHRDRADKYGDSFSKRLIPRFISITYMFAMFFVLLPILIQLPLQMIAEELNTYTIDIGIETYLLISSLFLSLIGGLIWLGTYYKSRENDERILEAEYSHKETLVIFFEEYSLRKEIFSDKEARNILLELHKHVIDSAVYNPSIRLGKGNSDHPAIKVINELSNNFTKVVDKAYDMPQKARRKNNPSQPKKSKKLNELKSG